MSIPSFKGKGKTPSSNWLNFQKQLKGTEKNDSIKKIKNVQDYTSKKKQKLNSGLGKNKFSRLSISSNRSQSPASSVVSHPVGSLPLQPDHNKKNGESIAALQQMVLGHMEYTESQKQHGKFLSLDCEMVGIGIDGQESSLARVSLVNFYGAVVMDDFVKQKERVVDYRTQWSGIRPSDMVHAKPFEEVQKKVADLLKDRILVGHAVHNDLKVLLLSHPWQQTRDTQVYAYKHKVSKAKYAALRNLVKQELQLTIQGGEHSSVTDARATMAVYRLHKKEWEKNGNSRPLPAPVVKSATPPSIISNKRKEPEDPSDSDSYSFYDNDDVNEPPGKSSNLSVDKPNTVLPNKKKGKEKVISQFPGGGRKGVSSGLSTVIHRPGVGSKGETSKGGARSDWWKQLPGSLASGSSSKGSIRVKVSR